jgi:peptidyl-prolyl cis-trans isomerase D
LKDLASFEERAKTEGVAVLDAKKVTSQDRSLGNLGDARTVVQWLFRDAEVGDISEIFDLQDKYVVAIMTDVTKKGNRPLASVKEEIMPEVRKEAKARVIIEKLKTLNGTLEEIASAYGSDANVYSTSDLKLSNASLPTAGYDPETAGLAFSLENGKRSAPVKGQNGVFVLELQNKTIAPAMEDYTTFKDQLLQTAAAKSGYSIGEAIKEKADIKDTRYKFY